MNTRVSQVMAGRLLQELLLTTAELGSRKWPTGAQLVTSCTFIPLSDCCTEGVGMENSRNAEPSTASPRKEEFLFLMTIPLLLDADEALS